MKLPPEGARWLVWLRWWACGSVFIMIWLASSGLGIVASPAPLYTVAAGMVVYNLLLRASQAGWTAGEDNAERNILLQVACDLAALTLLLYFSDLPRNPFLVYFVFHMIISGMYLRGSAPAMFAAMVTVLVGSIMLLEYLGQLPEFPLHIPRFALHFRSEPEPPPLDGLELLGKFAAFASALWITVYFTTSIRRYVDRAHAEIRQKEKMLGIGQLVAGIAHQIANPLDGVQNCLRRVGERVKNDPHLTEYVRMMTEALQRIERTATRVQAFARPRGITLQSTDANAAVRATLEVLGPTHVGNVQIVAELADVAAVQGDPYTLQEVLFNLCTNALAAMPDGGTLTLRTYPLGRRDEDQMGSVAIAVSDTGVGIRRADLEKIFEPFYTTRGSSGGTGLGLGLCRMLISEMGGRIEVRSVLGQGSTFTVVLNPAAKPPRAAS
ncbi:MAG: ATP-binding protein [Thermoguttaceae bacterium]|jgi:signal transduction histidine kinase